MGKLRSITQAQRLLQWAIILGVLALTAFAIYHIVEQEMRERPMISMGKTVFRAEVAKTPQAREKGLSGKDTLASDEALLLVFESDKQWDVWMKNMKFPVDIVWVDKSKKVVAIDENVQPDALPYEPYAPPIEVRYAVKIAAGQAKRANISVGSTVKFDITKEGL